MLMHHADTKRDRVMWIPDRNRIAIERDLAAIRSVETINDLHRRRFPRPILTHDRMDRAFMHSQRNVLISNAIAEGLFDVFKFEHQLSLPKILLFQNSMASVTFRILIDPLS